MSEYPTDDELLLVVRAARPAVSEEATSPNGAAARATLERVVASDRRSRSRSRSRSWPWWRLRSSMPFGSRRRAAQVLARLPVLASILVAVLVAAIALIALKHSHASGSAGVGPSATNHYTSPEGWSITYPATMKVTRSTSRIGFFGSQVTVASFAAVRTLSGRTRSGERENLFNLPFDVPLDASGRFPADGVALVLQPSLAGFLGPDSRFPIALNGFGAPKISEFFSKSEYRRDAVPPARSRPVIAYGQEVTATALIGRDASPALQGQLANLIASLSFPRLRPGTRIGIGVVVGPASDYPVGSFTLVHVRFANGHLERVYLVHAPGRLSFGQQCLIAGPCVPSGAFYGIGSAYNTRLNHAPQCDLRLDRRNDDFYCTNLAVRWDRVGRVISRPASESYVGSSEGLYAKVAWDGQILMIGGWGPEISRPAVHRLWPNWHQPHNRPAR